jgi:hypothetical protein
VGINFFPLYRVIAPMIFFMSLLLLVWGALRLVVTIFLRVALIIQYRGCGVWVLTAFWGTLFQLAMSPFNWIDGVMQDVGRKVGMMLESEAIRGPGAEEADKQNVENLRKKYPWAAGGRGDGGPHVGFQCRDGGYCEPVPRKVHKGVRRRKMVKTTSTRGVYQTVYSDVVMLS